MPYFTLQDIVGVLIAFILFLFVFLFPGYCIGYTTNLLGFKHRLESTKYIFAIVISASVVPIIIYLISIVIPLGFSKYLFIVPFVWFLYLNILRMKELIIDRKIFTNVSLYQKIALLIAAGWLFVTICMMVDIQWGEDLYFNVISMDFATRVTLVDAVTRTGIPPVNPSYFPGHSEYINSLYYFWYILCSVIDQFGGDLVDARMAVIAGDAWIGIILMSVISIYLKLRNDLRNEDAWKTSIIGIGLLAISGLDFIPAVMQIITTRLFYGYSVLTGDIEHWNEQITAWAGSLLWVPHHVAALVACIFCLIVFYVSEEEKCLSKKIQILVLAGLSLASAIGLSTWVAIVFFVFAGVASLYFFFLSAEKRLAFSMMFIVILATLFATPFLVGILKNGSGTDAAPVVFEVRKFLPIYPFIAEIQHFFENLIYLFLLPVNYLMELGFFFFIGLMWLQSSRFRVNIPERIKILEITLISVVVLITSFFRSSIVSSNEIGWRGWLFGQFILLVWTLDVIRQFEFGANSIKLKISNLLFSKDRRVKLLTYFAILGILTSVVDLTLLRVWPIMVDLGIAGFPNGLSPDVQLGRRTYSSRFAYDFVRKSLSEDMVIQNNPSMGLDRPSGLYGSRQFAISYNAPYNVPLNVLRENSEGISRIFNLDRATTWVEIDSICDQYYINALIVNDIDPLWHQLPSLDIERTPIFLNNHYSVYICGRMSSSYP